MNRPTAPTELSPSDPGPSPRLRNLHQSAAYLGVSFWTIRDYVLAGILPTVSLPALRAREGERQRGTLRRVLVDVEDLDAFIAKHKSTAHLQSAAPANSLEKERDCAHSVPARRPR